MKTSTPYPLHIAFAALVSACVGLPGQAADLSIIEERDQADLSALEVRAQAFWSAVMTNDLFAAYEFEDLKPLGTVTLQRYVQRGGAMRFTKAEVLGSSCPESSDTCVVDVDVEYVIPALGRKPLSGQVKDKWLLIDGQWYRTTDRSTSPVRSWKNQ